jgi:hypothetical protein
MRKLCTTLLLGVLCATAHAQVQKQPQVIDMSQGNIITINSPQVELEPVTEKIVAKISDIDATTGFYFISNPDLMKTPTFSKPYDTVVKLINAIDGVQGFSFDGNGTFKLNVSNAQAHAVLKSHFGFSQQEIESFLNN